MPGSGAQRDPPSSPLSRRARPALASAAPAPLSRLPLPLDAKRWLATIPLLPLGLAALLAVIPTPAESALSTFQISTPRQCGPLTLNWTTPSGSIAGADEPFNLVLIPTSDQNEVLSNLTFTSSGNSHTIPSLPLGRNTEFIALLQDGDGASGGRVSQIVRVADEQGGGTACLADRPNYLDFTFYVDPTPPTVCQPLRIGWQDNATAPIGITGMIPGGESFDIPVTNAGSLTADWITRIPPGTNVLIAMSDGGARGSGGSSPIYTVGGTDTSCLSGAGLDNAVVYSSLALGQVPTTLTVTVTAPGGATTIIQYPGGSPSGGVSNGNGGGGGSNTNIGAIVGGVVGGVAGLAILAALLLLLRRRQRRAAEAEGPEMTTANRPWDPPVPRDPDSLPPSSAPFLGSYGSPSIGGRPSTEYGGVPPSAFSHVPPGAAYGSAGSDAHSTTSLMDGTFEGGRRSTEKRALAASAASGAVAGSSLSRRSGDGPNNPALDPPPTLGGGGRERANSAGSGARFVRHEDAGLVESAAGDRQGTAGEEEIVDLPPLYQDARPRTGMGASRGKSLPASGSSNVGRTGADAP